MNYKLEAILEVLLIAFMWIIIWASFCYLFELVHHG